MSEEGVVTLLALFAGYAQQWLRGFRWYSDFVTLLVSLAMGLFGAFWIGGEPLTEWRLFVWAGSQLALQILGGTALGHMAAQTKSQMMLAPKYNSFDGGK